MQAVFEPSQYWHVDALSNLCVSPIFYKSVEEGAMQSACSYYILILLLLLCARGVEILSASIMMLVRFKHEYR